MWRVIIRWSFNNDTSSYVRNALERTLDQCGIGRTTTGTWECPVANPVQAANKISDVLKCLADPTQVSGADPRCVLDHIWIYIDQGQSNGME